MNKNIKIAIYIIAKTLGLFFISRRLTMKHPRILGYHGGAIGDEWKFNGLLFMTRSTFEKRITYLKKNKFEIVKLNELVRTSSQKQGKHTIVAITFDDGWFSTWKELLPVLFENKIPSTLYLSTNYHEKKLPIVSVVISYMIWKSSNIKISIQGINNYINGNYHLDNKTESARLIENVSNWIEKTTPNHSEVLNILYKIAECACVNPNDLALDTRRFDPLTPLEISHCSNNNCAIELHGHNHSYPRGDPEQFENDLNKCINSIKSYSLPPPMHYCYPSGNYDEIAASILKKNRVISATTCDPGLVNIENGNDIYYLPRFLDGENIHMLEFEAEMSGFNELARRLLSKTAINY